MKYLAILLLLVLAGLVSAGDVTPGAVINCGVVNTTYTADSATSFQFSTLDCKGDDVGRLQVDDKGLFTYSTDTTDTVKVIGHNTNILYVKTNRSSGINVIYYNLTGFPGDAYVDIFQNGSYLTTINSSTDGNVSWISPSLAVENQHNFIVAGVWGTTTTTLVTSTTVPSGGGGGGGGVTPEVTTTTLVTSTTLSSGGFIPIMGTQVNLASFVDNTYIWLGQGVWSFDVPGTKSTFRVQNWMWVFIILVCGFYILRELAWGDKNFKQTFDGPRRF
jgi:hypothetical protein